MRTVPGREAEYALVRALHVRPPAIAGKTVGYRVKGILESNFSPEVSISYPPRRSPATRGSRRERERSADGTRRASRAAGMSRSRTVSAPRWGPARARTISSTPTRTSAATPTRTAAATTRTSSRSTTRARCKVGAEGLELVDKYAPNRAPAEGGYPVRNYVSGTVSTQSQYAAGGWRPFTWKPGEGETWAFECNCRLPANSPLSGVDPGWWSTDVKWTNEIDFFEEWGWNPACATAPADILLHGRRLALQNVPTGNHRVVQELSTACSIPRQGFHRYTTLIYPNNTLSEYIDGQLQRWVGVNGVAPAPPYFNKVRMSLLLTNALRDQKGMSGPNPYPGFSSGTRTFTARSIAVYEDGAHAGQHISGGGVAPGTTSGSRSIGRPVGAQSNTSGRSNGRPLAIWVLMAHVAVSEWHRQRFQIGAVPTKAHPPRGGVAKPRSSCELAGLPKDRIGRCRVQGRN